MKASGYTSGDAEGSEKREGEKKKWFFFFVTWILKDLHEWMNTEEERMKEKKKTKERYGIGKDAYYADQRVYSREDAHIGM